MKSAYLPIVFALLTALFWGMYGPTLAKSRAAEHDAFKPYLAIGLAYLVWGVVGGLICMFFFSSNYSVSGGGIGWGFIAGSLGAWGALTLTFAMFSGGTALPQIVMPIVFGGAVTVSAIAALIQESLKQTEFKHNPNLWFGIIVIGVGIVLVAYNTPHAAPHKKEKEEPAAVQHLEPQQPAVQDS